MAIAFVQSASNRATGAVSKAFTSNNTAGNLIVVAIVMESNSDTIASVADSRNTYAVASALQGSGASGYRIAIYYAKNIGAGANTVTVTPTTGTTQVDIAIHEYSGADTSAPLDVNAGASGNSAAANSGSATTTVANELIFGLINSNAAVTLDGTLTSRVSFPFNYFSYTADKIGASAGSYAVNGTLTSNNWSASMATFKPAGAVPTGPVYVLTIGGVTKTIARGTLSLSETINGRATAEFEVDSLNGTYRPAMDEEVIITENGVRIFGGTVNTPSESGLGHLSSGSGITTRVSAVDFNALADRRYQIGGGFPAGYTLKQVLQAFVPYLTPYGVTLDISQVTGPTLPTIGYDVKRLTDIFDELSSITGGYIWEIDYNKVLRMYLPGAYTAPFNISEGPAGHAIGDITVEPTRTDYANRVYVLAGEGERQVADTLGTGNGVTTTFTLNYTLVNSLGVVTNNAVDETLGTGATWTYNAGANTVTRSSAPAVGNPITMRYIAQFPIRVQAPLVSAEPTAEQTSRGLWETVVKLPDVFDQVRAQAFADAELVRKTSGSKKIRFVTEGLGLKRGQLITVTSTKRNLSGTFLIQEIQSQATGLWLRRTVGAISGTVLQTLGYLDTIKSWSSGGTASGGSTVLGTVTLAESGFFPDDVVANNAKGLPVNESALTNFVNSQVAGAAVRLGKVGDATTWYMAADDLHALPFPVPRLAWADPARLSGTRFHAALQIPIGTNDTAYLIPDGGGSGTLYLGAPTGVFGTGYRIAAVYAGTVDANAFVGGETGTWTPALSFGGATTGITYGTQTGTYSKMGNIVNAELRIVLTSKGTATGAAAISGLPYAGNLFPATVLDCLNMAGMTGSPTVTLGSSTLNLSQTNATGRTGLLDTNFTNTSDLRVGIVYRT